MYVFDGGKLAEFRKAAGLSQESLARTLDTSQQSIGRWENGKAEPGLGHLLALTDMYGVTLEELLGRQRPAETATLPLEFEDVSKADPAHSITRDELAKINAAIRRISTATKTLGGIFPPET